MWKTMLCLAMLAAMPAQSADTPQTIAGNWQGSMERGSARLPVSFDFPADAHGHGFFSAPDLGAIDVPLANIRSGNAVHWELVGDSTTIVFDGTEVDGTISGTTRENAQAGSFRLHRASTSTTQPYTEEKVTFSDGDTLLAGSVFAPRTQGRHPAVIFVHGSGAEGRWACAYLADYVARHGMVALVYDKAGVGESSGDWRSSSLEDLAADARAGIGLLAHRADVDPARLGVYGHSQGGEIAPLIAANDEQVKWVIAADGPVGPQFRQDLFRVDTLLAARYRGAALREAERVYAEFVDTARNGTSHAPLRADIARAGKAPWLDDLAIPDDGDWIWNWYRKAGNFDNTAAWAGVHVPVLLLFGGDDALVPARESIAQTTALLAAHGNTRVLARVYRGADHTLRIPPSTPDGWPRLAPGFPNVIVEFANGRMALR
ncbi:MAG TPA: alpha/beta fold hydrolase [Xanthomonadaceae bacterium]|jgi:hypothetical protein